MPALVAPVAVCNNELRLIPELEVEDAPNALDNSEFSEDTELMERVPLSLTHYLRTSAAERLFSRPFRRT
jgi:hypothetical protein